MLKNIGDIIAHFIISVLVSGCFAFVFAISYPDLPLVKKIYAFFLAMVAWWFTIIIMDYSEHHKNF